MLMNGRDWALLLGFVGLIGVVILAYVFFNTKDTGSSKKKKKDDYGCPAKRGVLAWEDKTCAAVMACDDTYRISKDTKSCECDSSLGYIDDKGEKCKCDPTKYKQEALGSCTPILLK